MATKGVVLDAAFKAAVDREFERPTIRIDTDEHLVSFAAEEALVNDETVYQRDGMLVHVVRDASARKDVARAPHAPRIVPLPQAVLRERMAARAQWLKFAKTARSWEPSHPPEWAVAAVHAHGSWRCIRRLEGVVEAPCLLGNGSVLEEPGYHPQSGLLFAPTTEFMDVPKQPTLEDAQRALAELLDVVVDFPFARPEHRAAWVAALLTPLARHAFDGPSPLFLFDANTRGSGKSKLADVISCIVAGREMARMPPEDRDEEQRKRITAIATEGDAMVLIDNAIALGGPALDAALTGTSWFDRVLGMTGMARVTLKAVWYASGNNVQLRGDLARRTLHSRLETSEEHPEERTGFRHPDLLAWVKKERPRLLRAALTILRAWYAAGRPDQRLTNWGSFEGWSRAVRGPVVWLGLPDPFATRLELRNADADSNLLPQLIAGFEEIDPKGYGITIRGVLSAFEKSDKLARLMGEGVEQFETLRAAFDELSPAKANGYNLRAISNRLKAYKGRVIGGKSLDLRIDPHSKVGLWSVKVAGTAGSAGSLHLSYARNSQIQGGGAEE